MAPSLDVLAAQAKQALGVLDALRLALGNPDLCIHGKQWAFWSNLVEIDYARRALNAVSCNLEAVAKSAVAADPRA
ncbi:MAG: hypothetical protein RIR41_1626 [Pseudomonadota bacterium]|jgi:hypothetical protein